VPFVIKGHAKFKLDRLINDMQRPRSDIGEDVRIHLIPELIAGRALAGQPRPDPKLIEILLLRPLAYLKEKMSQSDLGKDAREVLQSFDSNDVRN
jgi:hypothetical protein